MYLKMVIDMDLNELDSGRSLDLLQAIREQIADSVIQIQLDYNTLFTNNPKYYNDVELKTKIKAKIIEEETIEG